MAQPEQRCETCVHWTRCIRHPEYGFCNAHPPATCKLIYVSPEWVCGEWTDVAK